MKPNVSSSLAPVGDVKVKRLIPDAIIPTRSHPDDAGVDLSCTEDVILAPGERALVGTGIAVALPVGTVGLVHPRSGLAHKHGLSMVNAPGTIDAGYRGELKVNLINLDPQETIRLPRGSRIAQLVVQRVELCDFIVVDELDETARGAAGHGSTGTDARA
ncbi:dUTP diphosphatase [Corynebacterium tapiri]|uniref:Deoxyuridine 5'-triphosphate nucleotidohydrolase n=1 Tax=Corynebacterium tapiri TaxID=1448266 RepID=A0A5C4U7H8_9CORY|nr:dUTP diphosphatase [Corynebacterium tapiri]